MAEDGDDEDLDDDEAPLDLSKDKVCDLSGTYCWTLCPHCQKKNWLYLGRMDDLTVPDVEAMRCHSCDKLSWIDGEVRREASLDRKPLEDAYQADGKRTP